jgi:hypothetical protein
VIEWLNGKIVEVTQLARNASIVAVIVVVLMTYYKARALVPVVVAALVGGVFLWSINHPEWWVDRVGDESGARVVIVDVDPLGPGLDPTPPTPGPGLDLVAV